MRDLKLLLRSLGSHLQQPVIFKVLRDDHDSLLHTRLLRVYMDLRVLWCLIRRTDTSELLDLASFGLLVQTLRISLLCFFNRNINEDFDEGQWRVRVLGVRVELASDLAVSFVG